MTKDTILRVIVLIGYCLVAVGFIAITFRHTIGEENGKWGQICRQDNTCVEGLVCVFDNHGYNKVNRRSMCFDKRTMEIN